jgi:leucyl aminopeptidase
LSEPAKTAFVETLATPLEGLEGRIAVLAGEDGRLDTTGKRLNRLTRGAVSRLTASTLWSELKPGEAHVLSFPAGLAAEALIVAKLGRKAAAGDARKAGAAIAARRGKGDLAVFATGRRAAAELALGLALMDYGFDTHKTRKDEKSGSVTVVTDAAALESCAAAMELAASVHFTRDLVNEPANVLTTEEFATRLLALRDLGLEVDVLDEAELARLGMRALLGVGQGSPSPSKVVVMQWKGGGSRAPLALVGKGVVFDTGGISIKPAAGMEDMTMDMGGAAVVAGVMRTLALRKARANVVGLVGLVENMPDGLAQRPGDVVTSMKGDTIEVINTDAEGRLVLADVLWYAQETFNPSGIVDLATLTGAIIIGLGHEMAGVFSNNDEFADRFLRAAREEGEGAWRMPLSPAYDKALKSRIADMMNVGGRPAGAVTAAQFIQRFVKPEIPWIHLDIAGVASVGSETETAPKGATGWGVRSLDRLIREHYED